jgi:hypothetical protein
MQAKLRGLMPSFIMPDFMTVANIVGKEACAKRFELYVAKYPAGECYLRTQLNGPL